jgi:alpha-amylase
MILRPKFWLIALLIISLLGALTGCYGEKGNESKNGGEQKLVSLYPHGVFYEIFPMAFYDSNGDGIGDLNGITAKLDYLKDLGIEGIWLMPINPSPSYHKYDTTDYYGIDAKYGTLEDFKNLLDQAHERNINVLMDLVVNHTSKDHPWFKGALSSKDSPHRNWYIWADENTKTSVRGEWDQPVWHGGGINKYYGTFWSGMPDLNFDSPEVQAEIIKIGQYWLQFGVDGFRLDAAKHIFTDEVKEKNYAWWQKFRASMEEVNQDVFLVGEVWATASVVAPYLKDGLTSTFNFDLSEKIISSVNQERDAGIVHFLERIREYYSKMDQRFVDSTFLSNHDTNRVMTQLKGNIQHAKMAASILLTLPGSPFLYYGEEIGMEGAKPDEHIREPMLWFKEPDTEGQAKWIRPRHNIGDKAISLEKQMEDPNSLYHHYKTMIQTRRSSEILVLGEIKGLNGLNDNETAAFKRVWNEEALAVIHNLSKQPKTLTIKGEDAKYNKIFFTTDKDIKLNSTDGQLEINIAPYSTVILQQK